MSDLLIDSVALGGDVDTVASLALAIVASSDEVENDLPHFLYDDLENKKYGKRFLQDLDNLLLGKFFKEKLA